MRNKPEEYIEDVLNNKIVVCRYVKLAVQRHVNDLKRTDIYFDEKAAGEAIRFFTLLKHFQGKNFAGKEFELSGWQAFIIYSLFGWKKQSGLRRFRLSYTEVAKKNGKSFLTAAISLFMLVGDSEEGAEVYSCATTRDQAKIIFTDSKNMVLKSPELSQLIQIWQYSLVYPDKLGKFEVLSREYRSFEGKNPYCGIVDEYHAHKDDLLFSNLKAATVAREESLIWVITTAGYDLGGPCFQFRKMCIDVLEGRLIDDNLFAMIFTLDEGEDWHNQSTWIKANPNLNISVFEDALKSEFQQAINSPEAETHFKTKNLNLWLGSGNIFISDEKFQKCNHDYPDLTGCECWGGLDLSSKYDITCFGLLFKKDNIFHWKPWFFIPELNLIERVKKDNVNYDVWLRQGHIIQTEGNYIDYGEVRKTINTLQKKYRIQRIAIDSWGAGEIVTRLQDDGLEIDPYPQNYSRLSEPTKELEGLILSQKINFAGNPVMRWMVGNTECKNDGSGHIRPIKKDGKNIHKIDGVVALIMALGTRMSDKGKGSVYDTRGILEI